MLGHVFKKVGWVFPLSATVYVCHKNTKGELNTLNWLVKTLRDCSYALAVLPVYEIGFICRTVYLNSMDNCQTIAILALSITFNCSA